MTEHTEALKEQFRSSLRREAEVEKALDYLRDSAPIIGHLTEEARRTENMLKHIKALEMKKYNNLAVSAQEREAYASDTYKLALLDDAKAAGELAKAKAWREAAAIRLDVWRSEQANYRSMKL